MRWYGCSTKFDPTFPQNHADLGWALTNQWHADSNTGSPPVGWYADVKNGYWSLVIHQQSSPGVYLKTFSIIDVPLPVGTCHDVKMQIKWSKSDTAGSIKLWPNGVQQTFVNGSTTYNIRTLIPGSTTVYYKEGMYRQATTPTDIVYHTGFRTATDEGGLYGRWSAAATEPEEIAEGKARGIGRAAESAAVGHQDVMLHSYVVASWQAGRNC